MIRHTWKAVIFSLLAACGSALPEGEVEPIRKVMADNRALPYECVNYDTGSDSCEVLVTRRVSGNNIRFLGTVLINLPEVGPTPVEVALPTLIYGDVYCTDMRNVDVRIKADLSPSARSLYEEVALAELVSMGEVCGAYYREGAGYLSVTTDRAGRVLPDGIDRSHFFRTPKRLRL